MLGGSAPRRAASFSSASAAYLRGAAPGGVGGSSALGGAGSYESLSGDVGGAHASGALLLELEVVVGPPEPASDGLGGGVAYPVHTRSNLPSFSCAGVTVRRRLSDFACLRERLRAFCPGIVVPALPELSRLADASPWAAAGVGDALDGGGGGGGGFGAADATHAALQAFCVRVAAHPLLRECPDLALFLTAAAATGDGDRWADALRWYERAAVGTAVVGTLNSLIDQFAARADLLLTGGGAAAGPGSGTIEEDAVYCDAVAYVTALEEQLTAATAAAAAAAAAVRAQAASLRELGGAAGALGATEQAGFATVVGARGGPGPGGGGGGAAAQHGLGEAMLAVGALAAECAGPAERASAAALASAAAPLRGALRTCAAVREVAADRAAALARLQAAAAKHALRLERLADAAAADAAAAAAAPSAAAARESLDPSGAPQSRKAHEAEVAAAAAALESAREAYDLIAGRMAAELPRVHAELARDVAGALRALVAALGDAADAQAVAWSRLVPGAADAPLPWPPAATATAGGDDART